MILLSGQKISALKRAFTIKFSFMYRNSDGRWGFTLKAWMNGESKDLLHHGNLLIGVICRGIHHEADMEGPLPTGYR